MTDFLSSTETTDTSYGKKNGLGGQAYATREVGERTPLLRGRTTGELHGGAGTTHQTAPDKGKPEPKSGTTADVSPFLSALLSSSARSRLVVPLSVVAVAAALLLVAVGLVTPMSWQAVSPTGGGASLAGTAPEHGGSGTARHASRPPTAEDAAKGRPKDDSGTGSEGRGGSDSGWRSQPHRSTGTYEMQGTCFRSFLLHKYV